MRPAVLGLLASALLLGATAPAHAETWSAPDRRGDVRVLSFDPDYQPCDNLPEHRDKHDKRRDIRGIAVDNGLEAVVLTLTFREVEKRDRSTSYALHVRTPRRAYFIDYVRGDGDVDVFMAEEPDFPNPSEITNCMFATTSSGVACDGLDADVSPEAGQVVVTIPSSCLGAPSWVRVAAQSVGSAHRGNQGRFALSSDFWGPRGAKPTTFLPPFGPRVHSS